MPLHDLIILCCHATYAPVGPSGNDPYLESNWRLQSFQQSAKYKRGEHETFMSHARQAVDSLKMQANACLAISGGATTKQRDISESQSYLDAIRDSGMLSSVSAGRDERWSRIFCEERATDSYQNLLFSILLFQEIFSRWPRTVTIITHAFKANRFLDCHAMAIGWPTDRIYVQGINPPFSKDELDRVLAAENETIEQFRVEPHGVRGPLFEKRRLRGWSNASREEMNSEVFKLRLDDTRREHFKMLLLGSLIPDSSLWM